MNFVCATQRANSRETYICNLHILPACTGGTDPERVTDEGWPMAPGRCRPASSGSPSPRLLLLVSEGSTHGYELLERLPALIGEERVDVGNVYRALRALEEDALVVSEWRADLPGPAKRSYTLTDDGRRLLGTWLEALGVLRDDLTTFLDDSRKGGEHVRKTRTPQP